MPNVSCTNLQHQSPDCVAMLHQHLPCNTTNPNNNWPLGHHLARPFKPYRFKPPTDRPVLKTTTCMSNSTVAQSACTIRHPSSTLLGSLSENVK